MSPTICSSTSSIVTSPATPPYSSITIAMWLRLARNSRKQHVEPLGFGHEHRRAQHLAHVEFLLARVMAQQVFGEQHADDVVAVLVDHREARVRGGDHLRDEGLHRLVDVDEVHLRARDHDVAHRHLGHA